MISPLNTKFYIVPASMPDTYLQGETNAYTALINIRNELKADAPLVYYVKAPLIYLSKLVFNSGTSNLYFFQEPFRHYKLLNFLRYVLFGFNVILYAGLFINLFRWRKIPQYIYIVLIPILYLIVLCWFFRSVEQRYMYPVYPFLLIGLGNLIQVLVNRKFKKYEVG